MMTSCSGACRAGRGPGSRGGSRRPHARDGRQLAIAFGVGLGVILVWSPMFGALAAGTQVVLGVVVMAALAGLAWWHRAAIVSAGAGAGAGRPRLDGWQLAVGAFAALVAILSVPVVANLASRQQAMNRTYDRLALVNTYGAFGSVGDDAPRARDRGHPRSRSGRRDVARVRAAVQARRPRAAAVRARAVPPAARLADLVRGDGRAATRSVGDPPGLQAARWRSRGARRCSPSIRSTARRRRSSGSAGSSISSQPLGADTWWTRDGEQLWLRPYALADGALRDAIAPYGWPSPSVR